MTHNFKHIIVKREDNQLVCLCYPDYKPPHNWNPDPYMNEVCEELYNKRVKAWEESVVRIPFAINQDVLSLFDKFRKPPFNWSDEVFYEELSIRPREINPELVEIREEDVIDEVLTCTLDIECTMKQQFAYLSSPKEEKAENKCGCPVCAELSRVINNKPVEEVKEEESEAHRYKKALEAIVNRFRIPNTNTYSGIDSEIFKIASSALGMTIK